MTARDRIVIIVLAGLAVLAVAWMMVVSPERKKAAQVQAKVQSARAELSVAQSKLAEAQQDEKRYAAAYSSIVSLGQAVPAESEVSSLVYELDHATSKDKIDFESITSGGSGGSSSTSSTTVASTGGFQQLPFTFSFSGTYKQLYELMQRLQGFTVSKTDGSVDVNGRLLSIQGLSLTGGGASGGSGSAGASGSSSKAGELKATVTATAYILPPGQSLTGVPGAAAGATPAASGSSASPATPAIVRPLP
jgi:Tfp pilus assembly protein PilO